MAELPYMPLWTDAYLSDTDHLSFEEHGIYLKLLMLMWRIPGCQLPNDEVWICRRLRVSKTQFNEQVKPLMEEFLDNTGNYITSRRLQREFTASKNRSRQQSVRAKSRWNKEKGVCRGNASIPISIPIKKNTTNVVYKEKEIPPKKRATRIPDGWQPSAKQFDFALTKLKTEERVRNEIEKFKNYYQAKSGEKAKSIIWDKTFNNWIRSDYCTKPDDRPRAGDLLTAVSTASSRIASGSRLRANRIPDDEGSQSAGQGNSHQDAGQSIRALANEHDIAGADQIEAKDNGEKYDDGRVVVAVSRLRR